MGEEDRPLPCVNLTTALPGGEDTHFTDGKVRLQSTQPVSSKAAERPLQLGAGGGGEPKEHVDRKRSRSHFRSGPLRPPFLEANDIPAPLEPIKRCHLAPSLAKPF